ncbi:MAG: SHOCT domain-containing protein [Clostridia bacterium]|nr:SHOCT domain-containing protein [Clostridia bacterium]
MNFVWRQLGLCVFRCAEPSVVRTFLSLFQEDSGLDMVTLLPVMSGYIDSSVITTGIFCIVFAILFFVVIFKIIMHFFKISKNLQKIADSSANQDAAKYEEIKKLKALLDQGVITQEEFEAKKKQLLGL